MSDLERIVAEVARREAESVMRDCRARFVTQHTSQEILGIPARGFLEWTRAPNFPLPVIRRGKTRMVELEPLIAYLRTLGERPGERTAPEVEPADEADAVLAEVLGPAVVPLRQAGGIT